MKMNDFFYKNFTIFYGIICVLINALAVILSSLVVTANSSNITWWQFFLNSRIQTISILITFSIPSILCTVYGLKIQKSNNQQRKKLLVNLPFIFSLIGIVGWICWFLINLIFLFIFKFQTGLPIFKYILEAVFIDIFLFIFTFMNSFFVLETINRKFILPRFIPDGHVANIKGVLHPSITLIYILLYISLCLFPCFIFFINLSNFEFGNENIKAFILLGIILILNLLLTIIISRFYSIPLLRLKDCAQNIANGNYNIHTGITTGDEIGILSDTFNEMAISLQEKELMYDTFGKIVTPEIRNWLLKGNTNLGEETVCATILFCDIRGFTTISEQIEPKKVVSLLNKYFSNMEQCIVKHNGIINKYIGDAIMAIFGVPLPNENQALDAYNCCLDMRKTLIKLNKELETENLPQINFGIGLHTGNVLAGNIGSNSRMEYTVIGDTVNVASRIESLCKKYNCDLLLSETTVEKIKCIGNSLHQLQSIGETEIRGRKTAINIYKG